MNGIDTTELYLSQPFCSSGDTNYFVASAAMAKIPEDASAAGRWLKQTRIDCGLSAQTVANRVNVLAAEAGDPTRISQQVIAKFEKGEAKRTPAWVRFTPEAMFAAPPEPDIREDGVRSEYVEIAVLPSYAGMGGGGTGEGDREIAKLPRKLIEDQLRGRSADFELIDVRGDSMMPDFHHGDQILVDKRDRDPIQPGPFAMWDGDGYVVKIVERVPQKRGFYRVFSANERYQAYEVEETETVIMGRPVWFARRL